MSAKKTRKKLITHSNKLSWLHQKNIVPKPSKPSKSTVNRLYSFYHRNPLSTPLYEAYGLHKRIYKRVDVYGSEYELNTPIGLVKVGKYYKQKAQKKEREIKKQIHFQAIFKARQYRPYVKRVQDYLTYRYKITANEKNLSKVIANFRKNNLPIIKHDVNIIARSFGEFYKTIIVGSIAIFKSQSFPQGKGTNVQRVGFTYLYKHRYKEYLDFFIENLMESIIQGFMLIKEYDNFSITLTTVEIVFTSETKISQFEKLRL